MAESRSSSFGIRVRRIAAVAACTALLAACGGQPWSSSAAADPPRVVLDSLRATTAAKSARVSMTVDLTGLGALSKGVGDIGITVDGLADLASNNAIFNIQFSGAPVSVLGDGIETRVVDGVSYVRLPSAPGLPSGLAGKWIKSDLAKLGGAGASPGLGQSTDPGGFLAALAGVSDSVRAVGTEAVRGVSTTHYHALVDLAKLADGSGVPPALRDRMKQMLELMSSASDPSIPLDVWIDGNGLVRRVQTKIDLSHLLDRLGISASPVLTMSMDLYDFGVSVNVPAPPASDVVSPPLLAPSSPS